MSNLPDYERVPNSGAPEDGGAEPCWRCKQEKGDHEYQPQAIDEDAGWWECPDGRGAFTPWPDEDDLRDAAREGRWD